MTVADYELMIFSKTFDRRVGRIKVVLFDGFLNKIKWGTVRLQKGINQINSADV